MRAHIVIVGAGISGLTAAITIGEGVDKLIAAGETIARPEMTLLDAADWIGGRARTDELSTGVSVDAGAHWFHGGARNPFYKWACDRHYDLGPIGIDTATRRFNVSVEGAVAPEQREWAMNRLYEMYAIWKAQHRDEDVSLRQLADMSKSRVIVAVAEERANNWMAVDSAAKVSSDEFWGDDAGSGGMQLQDGIEKLIAAMTNEARYYKADIQLRRVVQTVKKGRKALCGRDRQGHGRSRLCAQHALGWRAEIARRQIRQQRALAAGSGPGGHDGGENDQDCRAAAARILCRTQYRTGHVRHDLRTASRLAPAPSHRRQAARHHLCFRRDVGSGGEIAPRRHRKPDARSARARRRTRCERCTQQPGRPLPYHRLDDQSEFPGRLFGHAARRQTPQSAGDRQPSVRGRGVCAGPEEKPQSNDRRLGVGTHRGEEDFDKAGAGDSQGGRRGIGAAVELNVLANGTNPKCRNVR